MRALMLCAALLCAAAPLSAQDMYTKAKAAATKARDAESAHIANEQRGDDPAQKPAPAARQTAPAGKNRAAAQRPGAKLDIATSDTGGPPPTIYREVFEYEANGRRDPFVSLLTTSELRPALSDLTLTGIAYWPNGRSVAALRDASSNKLYSVTTGTALGRMRVAAIRPRTVVFTIEEFGTTREDSLVLRDSTRARAK
jgi:hypothetical protein